MNVLFIEYPKCSTCQKAKAYLKEHGADVVARHIVEQTPDVEELRSWWKRSGLPLKKWFNTSGNVYKELQLKNKLPSMNEEEQLQLLSEHDMLIKRPIVVCDDCVLIGFQEDNYANLLSR